MRVGCSFATMLCLEKIRRNVFVVADGDNLEDGEDDYLPLHGGVVCVLSLRAVHTFIVCFAETEQGSGGE